MGASSKQGVRRLTCRGDAHTLPLCPANAAGFMLRRYTWIIALAFLAAAPRAQTYVDVIDPEGTPTIHDLEWRNGELWATDRLGDRMIQIDLETGAILQNVVPGFEPVGLAWDGSNWRVSEGFTSSPDIFTVTPAGAVVGMIPALSQLTNGLAFHEGLLFSGHAYPDSAASIRAANPVSGAQVERIAFPSTQPTGVAFTGPNTFWAANAGDDGSNVYQIYEIDRTTGAVLRTLDPPEGVRQPRGVAYDGSRYLYITFRTIAVPVISVIYKVDLQATGNAEISLSSESFDFGPRATGGAYQLPLLIQNNGDAPLTISNVQVATIPENPFGTTLTPTTIPPAGQITVQVTWAVSEPMQSGGTLSFETNDVNRPTISIPLSGIGVNPVPSVTFLESAHDFGPTRIDEPAPFSTRWWPMRIVNMGAQQLNVSGVTFTDPAFSVVATDFPLGILPADTADVLVEFRPPATGSYSATATVASNDPDGHAALTVAGEGIDPTIAGGAPLWQWVIPMNPATSSTDRKVFSIEALGDVTGDGRSEIALASRNYWTMVVDANGWNDQRIVWSYSSCPNNNDCGAVSGNAQLYEYGLATADMNNDGTRDVVIGTEGGHDKVVVLNGLTGVPIWTVGSDSDPYLASYYSVSPRFDVNGDGIPEVATGTGSASDPSPNPFNHRRVYLLNGANGNEIWQAQTTLPNFRTSLVNTSEGLRVITGGGESGSNFVRSYVATSGGVDWTHTPSFSPFLVEPISDSPAGGNEDVLAAGLGAIVQRLDGATGAVEWTANPGGSSVWDLAVIYRPGDTPLVIAGSTGSDAAAIDAVTGLTEWTFPMGGQVFDLARIPDVDGDDVDDVGATGRFGQTTLISGATGMQIWNHVFGNNTFDQSGEIVAPVPDLDGNGIAEVVFGVRDGRVTLLHGGNPVPTTIEPGTLPTELTLATPAPNPVRDGAVVRFALPAPGDVRLALYDALGRAVWRHAAAAQPAGSHHVSLDAGALAAGVYVLRLEAGGEVATRRVVVAR